MLCRWSIAEIVRQGCRILLLLHLLLVPVARGANAGESLSVEWRRELQAETAGLLFEAYTNSNWEIFVAAADGTQLRNLTQTPTLHELYPKASPDGQRIAFSMDTGEGKATVRSLWLMDRNGQHRQHCVENAREPFWSPDGRRLGFLRPEFPSKFNVMDYATRGMEFIDLSTGRISPHVNTSRLMHLYNPCFSPDGRWILATVHAGMGVAHGIVAIEAEGTNVVSLGLTGCRSWISARGDELAWGAGDYEIAVAPIDFSGTFPRMGPKRLQYVDEQNRLIHVAWSPDSKFLAFSRGPASRGDDARPGTHVGACGIVGVYAADWNICVAPASKSGLHRLDQEGASVYFSVTTNGFSFKQPSWIP